MLGILLLTSAVEFPLPLFIGGMLLNRSFKLLFCEIGGNVLVGEVVVIAVRPSNKFGGWLFCDNIEVLGGWVGEVMSRSSPSMSNRLPCC